MTDGIQKGSGNAYALQTVANAASLYPTYEQFIQAFATGQLFADLRLNPEGWDPLGTSLNKTNLLKDTTAALYGKTAAATPDEILAVIRLLITAANNTANSKAKIQIISYVGTGTYGEENPTVITFSFSPEMIFLARSSDYLRFTKNVSTSYAENDFFSYSFSDPQGGANGYGKKSNDGKTFSMYAVPKSTQYPGRAAGSQNNSAGVTYSYIAIG